MDLMEKKVGKEKKYSYEMGNTDEVTPSDSPLTPL